MNELQMMPGVEWLVAEEEAPAKNLVGAPTLTLVPTEELVDTLIVEDVEHIVTGEPVGQAITKPNIRPWARPVLITGLALAVVWLGVLIILLLSAELWAQASVAVGVAGFPALGLLTIGFMADPSHESPDEEYVPWLFDNEGSYAASMCSPGRHALTGRNQ